MKVVADLQLHSKYSRAVSPQMMIPYIWDWAKRKGIGLIATGDWTHPLWMREIKANLTEDGSGLLKIKDEEGGSLFLLATEVSSIYSQGGKLRRIHNLIWAPSFAAADKITQELIRRGANLISDGRPIVGLTSIQIAELVFSIDPNCLLIPAHAWTPWFSLFGSESGFDSIDECFGQFAKNIYAIETGLSSDPSMNWRIKELDNRSILSFSDAHSGPKLGREATVFELEKLSYDAIRKAIIRTAESGKREAESSDLDAKRLTLNANHIAYTIEFYPEEGKYHWTGHRNCGIKQKPEETRKNGTQCPVCGRKLTVGVMHRVDDLAGRTEEELKMSNGGGEIRMMKSGLFPNRPPYVNMVPLQEIIAETIGGLPTSQKVQDEYRKLTDSLGSEFKVLLESSIPGITNISGERIAQAIHKVRIGDIVVDPGYDGVFGKVKIWEEKKEQKPQDEKKQLSFF